MKIAIEISNKRIKDLLCNALEGGSNYWYIIKKYNYSKEHPTPELEFPHLDLPFFGGSLTIKDIDGDMPNKILDYKALEKGLQILADKYPTNFADFISENDDAITGDVFLQCALYGEVIFG